MDLERPNLVHTKAQWTCILYQMQNSKSINISNNFETKLALQKWSSRCIGKYGLHIILDYNIVFFESCPDSIRDLFFSDVMGLGTPCFRGVHELSKFNQSSQTHLIQPKKVGWIIG
jgi:hypothetical protein